MTRHSGGSFGGGGFSSGGHGRSDGGSFGPPSHYHPHHPHHERHPFPPPPPRHRRGYWPYFPPSYYSPPLYSPVSAVGTSGLQMPPPSSAVIEQYDRRASLLNRSKACFTFLWFALLIATLWLYLGVYGQSTMQLALHDSRLLSTWPFWVQSIRVKNRDEVDGPVFYDFESRPSLNQESRFTESRNETWSWGPRNSYYWLNKGSTVKVHYNMKMRERMEPVYFIIIQNDLDDLKDYYDRPNYGSSIRLRDEGEFNYKASHDADYAFSLANYNHRNVTVNLRMDFHTRKYDTSEAISHSSLKTECKTSFSFFRSGYVLLEGPETDKEGVDTWVIQVSYDIRWTVVILIYGLLTLVYLVTKSTIMASIHELDPALPPEYAPLVQPQETQPTAPSAPVLPTPTPDQYSEGIDKDVSEDKLCSVCLDARKDSFFVPCGHRATCYECGLRISRSEMANCPICRQPITEVKRIYDA